MQFDRCVNRKPSVSYYSQTVTTLLVRVLHLLGLAGELANLLVKLAHKLMHSLAPLVQSLLGALLALDDFGNKFLKLALETLSAVSLVAALCDNLAVIGDTATVPGEDLSIVSWRVKAIRGGICLHWRCWRERQSRHSW